MTLATGQQQQRAFSAHQPSWQRFQTTLMVPSKQAAVASSADQKAQVNPYQRQYAHVYHQRLAVLGPRCWMSVDADTDNSGAAKVHRILELRENVLSVAVGTLVKETPADDDDATLHPASECRPSDVLYLEDESGRVALQTDKLHQYCTGVVVAVQGIVGQDGVMQVKRFYHPAPPEPVTNNSIPGAAADQASPDDQQPHLLLVSGLQCGGTNVSSLPRDMLLSYLEGRFGVESAARISRVVLSGGLTGSTGVASVRELDGFCLQVAAAGIPMDVLPGKDDPTTANWPQRPLHSSLLKQSCRYMNKLIHPTPNPYAAVHANDKYVLGTDGTNVQDLVRHLLSSADNNSSQQPVTELQALQQTLEWSHVCPTGPDSVPTMPHAEQDPMVMTVQPNIYFCGNASKFATVRLKDIGNGSTGCRLVCVPSFATTGQAVLVNLETLDVELLRFEE